ncbi:MAG: hypothetical protein IBX60_09000 [Candidatus Aminicenantes bacterium]|nr:hypothetical protein [Candidatus Aminicenantes bacterium]
MKKKELGLIFFLFLFFIIRGISNAEKFGIKLTGGMSYLAVGDPNASLKGLADFLKDQASLGDNIPESEFNEFKKIHFGLDLVGDVIIYLTPHFGISLGSGYIYGMEGKVINKRILGGQTFTEEVKVSAIPVRLGVYYSLPLSSRARFLLNGGVSYYFAKWSEAYRNEWSGGWFNTVQEAKASGIGFHGGLGFEFNLVSNISFVLEEQGRYAKIGGFKGDKEFRAFIPGWESSTEGSLYYFEWLPWTDNWYPMIQILEEEPIGDRIRKVRKAKIDFSGFTLRAGIKIKF